MRARHEHQIRIADHHLPSGGWAFDAALNNVMARHRGTSWFTDEQIAEIRAEMIARQWFVHKLNRRNRARAILAKTTKEKTDV